MVAHEWFYFSVHIFLYLAACHKETDHFVLTAKLKFKQNNRTCKGTTKTVFS